MYHLVAFSRPSVRVNLKPLALLIESTMQLHHSLYHLHAGKSVAIGRSRSSKRLCRTQDFGSRMRRRTTVQFFGFVTTPRRWHAWLSSPDFSSRSSPRSIPRATPSNIALASSSGVDSRNARVNPDHSTSRYLKTAPIAPVPCSRTSLP